MTYENKKKIWLWKLVAILAVIAFLLAIFLPAFSKGPNYTNMANDLMGKIYRSVLNDNSREDILSSLSEEEREMVNKYDISWLENFPVNTELGKLKPQYLPSEHIVVYGTPEHKDERRKIQADAYVNATGLIFTLGGSEDTSLDQLIKTTNLGINEIIKGHIVDISEIPNAEIYSKETVYEYLLLKKLIMRNLDFPRYALDLALRIEPHTQVYVERLLRDSVESPPLPEIALGGNKENIKEWELWYIKNEGNIQFSNKFLFEKLD